MESFIMILPSEILLQIITEVGTDTCKPGVSCYNTVRGTKDLCHLALCSRRLNQLTTPILYETFVQTGKHALQSFTRCVLEKPALGDRVKRFVGTSCRGLDMSQYNVVDFSRCERAVHEIYMRNGDLVQSQRPPIPERMYMADLKFGSWNAMAGVLLSHLPSLEEIEIEENGNERDSGIVDILFVARRQQLSGDQLGGSLKHLHSVSLRKGDPIGGVGVPMIQAYLDLPSLRKLKVETLLMRHWNPSQRVSNVTDLQLYNSVVDNDALISLLRCCPNLKKFHYDHGNQVNQHPRGMCDFLPQKAGQALAHLKPYLEELLLINTYPQVHPTFNPYNPAILRPTAIGSLVDFERLHTLVIHRRILLGPLGIASRARKSTNQLEGSFMHLLPKTLRKLVLIGFGEQIVEQIHQIVSKKAELAPHLEGINLSSLNTRPSPEDMEIEGDATTFVDFDEKYTQELQGECKAVGIKLCFSRDTRESKNNKKIYWAYQ